MQVKIVMNKTLQTRANSTKVAPDRLRSERRFPVMATPLRPERRGWDGGGRRVENRFMINLLLVLEFFAHCYARRQHQVTVEARRGN